MITARWKRCAGVLEAPRLLQQLPPPMTMTRTRTTAWRCRQELSASRRPRTCCIVVLWAGLNLARDLGAGGNLELGILSFFAHAQWKDSQKWHSREKVVCEPEPDVIAIFNCTRCRAPIKFAEYDGVARSRTYDRKRKTEFWQTICSAAPTQIPHGLTPRPVIYACEWPIAADDTSPAAAGLKLQQ